MRKNDILKCGDSIFRVLDIKNKELFLIDCGKKQFRHGFQKKKYKIVYILLKQN